MAGPSRSAACGIAACVCLPSPESCMRLPRRHMRLRYNDVASQSLCLHCSAFAQPARHFKPFPAPTHLLRTQPAATPAILALPRSSCSSPLFAPFPSRQTVPCPYLPFKDSASSQPCHSCSSPLFPPFPSRQTFPCPYLRFKDSASSPTPPQRLSKQPTLPLLLFPALPTLARTSNPSLSLPTFQGLSQQPRLHTGRDGECAQEAIRCRLRPCPADGRSDSDAHEGRGA